MYRRTLVYLLAPAILRPGAEPLHLMELAILKRHVSVKNVADLKRDDLEAMALGEEQYRALFGEDGHGKREE